MSRWTLVTASTSRLAAEQTQRALDALLRPGACSELTSRTVGTCVRPNRALVSPDHTVLTRRQHTCRWCIELPDLTCNTSSRPDTILILSKRATNAIRSCSAPWLGRVPADPTSNAVRRSGIPQSADICASHAIDAVSDGIVAGRVEIGTSTARDAAGLASRRLVQPGFTQLTIF